VAAVLSLAAPAASAQAPAVYRVSVTGPITLEVRGVIAKAIETAEREGGTAVILDLASPGGRFDIAQLIVSDIAATDIPVYALVSQHAWGAAALISLGADSIFMAPQTSLGASPNAESESRRISPAAQEVMQHEFGMLTMRRGLDSRIGEAMVNRDIAIPDLVRAGTLLTLTAASAVRVGVAAAGVDDLNGLLRHTGFVGTEVVTVGAAWTGTTVRTTNYNTRDLRIFLVRGQSRFRLGTVTSMNTAEFDVPEAMLPTGASIRVQAEVIGSSERVSTEAIRVESGLLIEWVLEATLIHSNYFVTVR
jgi:membrane-bound ClpP family serine protease